LKAGGLNGDFSV